MRKKYFSVIFSFSNALFVEERTDPYKWPLNIVSQVFSGVYDRERINVYMLGNPIIWFPHLILILLLPILIPMLIIRSGKHSLTAFISLSLMYFSHLLFTLRTFLYLLFTFRIYFFSTLISLSLIVTTRSFYS